MLTGPLLLPPVVLALLLVISGLSKVRHAEATRSAFAQLELPTALVDSPAPRALPWLEILLGAALLLSPAAVAVPVAVLALLVFVAYLVVIGRALRFDHPVTCGCFGELGLGEVTRRTLVRNVLLVVLAVLTVVTATADASVATRLARADGVTWAWLGLLLLTGATLVATFGGTKGVPTSGDGAGTTGPDGELDYQRQPLPFASLVDAEEQSHTLAELVGEGAQLLVFVSPGCGSCAEAIDRVPQWAADLGPVRVRAVVAQPIDTVTARAPELAGHLLHDPQGATRRIFAVGTPGAVLLGGDGLLAGGPVRGQDAVRQFVDDIRAELLEAGVVTDGR